MDPFPPSDPDDHRPPPDPPAGGGQPIDPLHPDVLNYLAPRDEYKRPLSVGFKRQVGLGFLTWVGTLVLIGGLVYSTQASPAFDNLWGIGIAIPLIGLISLIVHLRVNRKWRGFLPGVLIGFCVCCLVPVGIVAVVCGWK
jgi:hypothetical protein